MEHSAEAAYSWTIPELAQWLEILPGELAWFANRKGIGESEALRHYRYTILAKRQGSNNLRLIESPKPRLKAMQRRILAEILDWVPTHEAAHGFCRNRSIQSFAAPHVGKRIVLKMDLRDFFPSIGGARIDGLFRTLGYSGPVARVLGGICTNVAPRDIWRGMPESHGASQLYASPHLPQGAPTSPSLANLCAYHVDCRLAGLAAACGAEYTRYADDLAFSSDSPDFERSVARFSTHVAAILEEEGFHVHHRKTRIMRQGVRQHLAGLVVNRRLNVYRADFDELKAILSNCMRHGPESQNREGHPEFRAHLEGRVAFVESTNPARGAKLRQLLKGIPWEPSRYNRDV